MSIYLFLLSVDCILGLFWQCGIFGFSLLSSIGIKVNVACVKGDKGCIQHTFCNSSSVCECSKGYSYKGGACKYLKSIYLYYFVAIKEKEIQFFISLICNTIFNAISSYIVVVGHNILWKNLTDHPYVNDLFDKFNQFYCHITKDSLWQKKQHTNNTTIERIVVCSTKYNTAI